MNNEPSGACPLGVVPTGPGRPERTAVRHPYPAAICIHAYRCIYIYIYIFIFMAYLYGSGPFVFSPSGELLIYIYIYVTRVCVCVSLLEL